jgi:putative sterol carrier protein
MADIQPYLQRIVDRVTNPASQATFKGFTKTLLFKFNDTHEDWLVRIVDGKEATFAQETLEQPDIAVITTTEVLAGVMDKKINGMTAYMQRKIQTKGAMEDLMKLQKLML